MPGEGRTIYFELRYISAHGSKTNCSGRETELMLISKDRFLSNATGTGFVFVLKLEIDERNGLVDYSEQLDGQCDSSKGSGLHPPWALHDVFDNLPTLLE